MHAQAIAAAAIASGSSLRETVAAGAWVSIAVLLLSATGLIGWLTRHIPVPVVKGIQMGAGLTLVVSAGTSLLRPLGWAAPPLDNRLWALAAFLGLVATQRRPRFPYALLVTLVAVASAVAAVAASRPGGLPALTPWHPRAYLPAFLSPDAAGMAVAQLPLTALNSVVAAAALAAELFPSLPGGATPPSATALGVSVAAMNLLGCWLGAMPVCHGAGGLAAQHRFGARSGASVVVLGAAKVVLGLAFGESLAGLLGAFPRALLGVLVLASGLELACVGAGLNYGAADLWETSAAGAEVGGGGSGGLAGLVRKHRELSDQERTERWTVMLMTTAGMLAFKNTAVGFAAGMICHWAYWVADLVEMRRAGNRLHGESRPLLH